MADKPGADIEVDLALVRRLLREQTPGLADLPLAVVAEGWDNVVLRLGEDLAVRVPRRSVAARLLLSEQLWLGPVANRVDVAVPAPVHCGTPTEFFPWHWSVVPWFVGRDAGSVPVTERLSIAAPLARFVSQMHVPAPSDAPANPFRSGPLSNRSAAVEDRLAGGLVPRVDEVRALWQELASVPEWAGPPLWLHGDLHPFNVLVSSQDDGVLGLAAVIDFGDMTAGDPACDLATAWLTFDRGGRDLFRAEIGRGSPVDENTWRRARGWALSIATALLAHSDDNPPFARLGAEALEQVLAP